MQLFVIITSYKEEVTIGRAVEQIICPNTDLWPVLSLFITSPDQPTLKKAEEVCQKHGFKNFHMIQDYGQGKASALNLAVETITKSYAVNPVYDLLILTDGDMYVANDAIKNLLIPFTSVDYKASGGILNTVNSVTLEKSAGSYTAEVAGVGGHPVSLDSRTNMFGYFSHLFCEAAHVRRLKNRQQFNNKPENTGNDLDQAQTNSQDELKYGVDACKPADFVPMSGYLYAIKFVDGLFPIPPNVRAEDAYISKKLVDLGYLIGYAPEALAYVRFPKNFSDWVKQKTRSLGGNVQLAGVGYRHSSVLAKGFKLRLLHTPSKEEGSNHIELSSLPSTVQDTKMLGIKALNRKTSRSIKQDLAMLFFPLTFAKTPKEFVWSLVLYPLRLYLWLKIYFNHIFNRYPTGMWERIESTKQ